MNTPSDADTYESMTDVELAGQVWLSLTALDDELPDSVTDKLRPAYKMAVALWHRLKGPYCSEEGCQQPHMASFPWCPWHRPESYGPLPDGFPPYPGATL